MKPNSFSIISGRPRIRISRRELLRGFGALGCMAALPAASEAQVVRKGGVPKGTAQTCIFINLLGAPSHVDTFDYKAGAAPANHKIITNGAITLNSTLFPKL